MGQIWAPETLTACSAAGGPGAFGDGANGRQGLPQNAGPCALDGCSPQ